MFSALVLIMMSITFFAVGYLCHAEGYQKGWNAALKEIIRRGL